MDSISIQNKPSVRLIFLSTCVAIHFRRPVLSTPWNHYLRSVFAPPPTDAATTPQIAFTKCAKQAFSDIVHVYHEKTPLFGEIISHMFIVFHKNCFIYERAGKLLREKLLTYYVGTLTVPAGFGFHTNPFFLEEEFEGNAQNYFYCQAISHNSFQHFLCWAIKIQSLKSHLNF